ncbi:hypothetical protein [Shewanella sp. GXUN23E]|uniref:hypothetical protein n=1 Tax=Shewanella sp. GXUN23E TaxID=3422498 RepID=UPI003D7D9175
MVILLVGYSGRCNCSIMTPVWPVVCDGDDWNQWINSIGLNGFFILKTTQYWRFSGVALLDTDLASSYYWLILNRKWTQGVLYVEPVSDDFQAMVD